MWSVSECFGHERDSRLTRPSLERVNDVSGIVRLKEREGM